MFIMCRFCHERTRNNRTGVCWKCEDNMIKNLIITYIPNEEAALKKVLKAVMDNTWSNDELSEWVENKGTNTIWYSPKLHRYVSGSQPIDSAKRNFKLYEELIL